MPTVSVVIPALNEKSNIRRAVMSAWQSGADEVIVADGGSQDGTVDIARSANGSVTIGSAGRAIQQNAGAKIAHGDVLLFQHADCWLAPFAIQQIKRLAHRRKNLCGGFRQVIESNTLPYRCVAVGNQLRVQLFGMIYGDQGIFVDRELFARVNGFDDVPLMEDVILSKNLRRLSRPYLLKGPIHVSNRRWKQNGIMRQTIRNWSIATAFRFGVSPERLASFYPTHEPNEAT